MLACGVSCAELMRQFRAWEFDAEKLPIVTPADLRSDERRFVFIDELDKARPSEYAAEQLFELIDAAYSHDQQIVITSNTPLDGLAEHWSRNAATIGASIVRRLMDMSGAILVDMFNPLASCAGHRVGGVASVGRRRGKGNANETFSI